MASIQGRLAEFHSRGIQRQLAYRSEVETQMTELQKELKTLKVILRLNMVIKLLYQILQLK